MHAEEFLISKKLSKRTTANLPSVPLLVLSSRDWHTASWVQGRTSWLRSWFVSPFVQVTDTDIAIVAGSVCCKLQSAGCCKAFTPQDELLAYAQQIADLNDILGTRILVTGSVKEQVSGVMNLQVAVQCMEWYESGAKSWQLLPCLYTFCTLPP